MQVNQSFFNIVQIILLVLIFLSVNKNLIKKSKLIVKRTLVFFIWLLSKLFPRSTRIVVFGAENGNGFRGNPKYLFLEMVKYPQITCIWISKNEKVVSDLRNKGFQAYKHSSLKGVFYQLRAKLVIHSHSINDDFYKVLLGGSISYLTWHGVGLKKVWGANKNTFTYKVLHEKNFIKRFFGKFVVKTNSAKMNYVVSTSRTVSSYYPETYLVNKENVLELGQVRNDIFFRQTEEDEEIPDFIKENKIILYMPTHRNFGKIDTDINLILDFQKLDEFCERTGHRFVIKMHMYSSGSVPKQWKHIIDLSNENIDPQFLLKYTDILVTDYSSCYTDYLLLDKPVAFYCYDLETYLQKSNDMYFNYFDVTPGPKTRTFTDLLDAIEMYIQDPSLYESERKQVLNVFYSEENQGIVLDKQVTYIYEKILGLNTRDLHNGSSGYFSTSAKG